MPLSVCIYNTHKGCGSSHGKGTPGWCLFFLLLLRAEKPQTQHHKEQRSSKESMWRKLKKSLRCYLGISCPPCASSLASVSYSGSWTQENHAWKKQILTSSTKPTKDSIESIVCFWREEGVAMFAKLYAEYSSPVVPSWPLQCMLRSTILCWPHYSILHN